MQEAVLAHPDRRDRCGLPVRGDLDRKRDRVERARLGVLDVLVGGL
ncbi:hypothetical protein [Actinomadura rubrisoli]|nr:hypothetical protein [Actinomadura rubrisoli]